MDMKGFKKPAIQIAFGKRVPVSNKENKAERQGIKENKAATSAQAPTPRKHNCVSSAPSGISVNADDPKSTGSQSGKAHGVDLIDWEAKARRTVGDFCTFNGIDAKTLFPEDGKKKTGAGPKPVIAARASAQSGAKLLPIFKALDTLLMEKDFPPADLMKLLKPLGDSFFVKRCAHFWRLYSKAAMMAENHELAVDLLDRGTKCGAEPLMEMQRAYGTICHRLVTNLNELKGHQMPDVHQENHAINNGDDGQNRAEGQADGDVENAMMNLAIDGDNFGENHDGVENTETDEGVETEKTVDMPDSQQIDHDDMERMDMIGQEFVVPKLENVQENVQGNGEPELDGFNHSAAANESGNHLIAASFERSGLHDISNRNETVETDGDGSGLTNGNTTDHHDESVNGHLAGQDGENAGNEIQVDAGALAVATLDQTDGSQFDDDQLSKLPTPPHCWPKTPRNRKNELDQSAIFKSSAKKLMVVENKTAKGGDGNKPTYHVTPVRRSTRKPGYDKWLTYRNANTVESPTDVSGFDPKKAAFVKNPYLPSDEEYDSD